ncbi:glycoside hydrolase family 3 N-terminal domain-containing protein [Brevibacterium album]|uniref:glycoside hydrolase family 3 N-terminal domain-containing protein n=1 Tax=Brevibacterium album TaxID=417948 RepID=UPI00049151B5|nr:glycoside hydrolase family 3 N-terminal domain-containing protein [Brevibacterium album]
MRRRLSALVLSAGLVLAGCSGSADEEVGGAGTEVASESVAPASPPASVEGAPDPAEGVSEEDREAAAEIVAGMSDEELVGSVVMMTYRGTDVQAAADAIRERHLAGAIVMGYNLPEGAGPEEVSGITDTLAGAIGERGWPVAIGVDQEGGPVARLNDAAVEFPPLMAAGAADDERITADAVTAQGTDVRNLGFTIDFAPVADVTVGSADPTINVRSPGSEQELVSSVATAAIEGYTAAGVASSAKHFPGHGALTVDSHESLPVSEESLEELAESSYAPFRAAAEANVPMMLVGHIGLPGAEELPATLNPDVYESLREDVGYDGVAVTDALNMGAVSEAPGQETVKAIRAGADLALMPEDSGEAVAALSAALESGELERERLTEASERVVAMQLWQHRAAEAAQVSAPDEAAADEAFTALADASLTVLAGECEIPEPVGSIRLVGGEEAQREAFAEAAEKAELEVASGESTGGTTVSLDAGTPADAVIGTGGPWQLSGADAETVLAVYDDNPHALAAAAKYLAGELTARGTVPVGGFEDAPSCG